MFQVVDNKIQRGRGFGRRTLGKRGGAYFAVCFFYLIFSMKQNQQGGQNQWAQRGRGGSSAAARGRGRLSAASSANQRQYQSGRGGFQGGKRYERIVKPREPSIEVKKSWKVIKTYLLNDFMKIVGDEVPEAEDLGLYGQLERYDQTCDAISSKAVAPLKKFENRQFFSATTSADPVLQQLSQKSAGTVYASDSILALLLCAHRSVYSWDIVITKSKGTLTLDKRVKSLVDFWTVAETGNEQGLQFDIKDDGSIPVNHPTALALEATFVNQNFSQHVLVSRKGYADVKQTDILVGDYPNPFLDQLDGTVEPSSAAYRYRKWVLKNNHVLVARTEVNGFVTKKNTDENHFISIKALNEIDTKTSGGSDYKLKLDTQAASVFATELKNNNSKIARWATLASLSGCDELRLGYVTRFLADDPKSHMIVAVQKIPAERFITQVGLNLGKMWAFVRSLFDQWMALEDGKYLLIKEPNEAKLSLHTLPASFALDEEDVEEDD